MRLLRHTNLSFFRTDFLALTTYARHRPITKGVGRWGSRGSYEPPFGGTTKINSQEFCMCSATVVLSGLPGTGPVGYS